MHHPLHIGAAAFQPASRVPLPAVKAADDGRFHATLRGILRPVGGSNSAGQEQPHGDAGEAPAGKPVLALCTPGTVPNKIDREPLQTVPDDANEFEGTAKTEANRNSSVVATTSIENGKETHEISPQPTVGLVTPKKSVHKDIGKGTKPAETPSADDAAIVPNQSEVPVAVALPRPVEAALPTGAVSMKPLEIAVSVDDSIKPKTKGVTASARVASHDAKKTDAAAAVSSPERKLDVASQLVTSPASGVPHDLERAGTAVAPQVNAVEPTGGSHRAISTGANGIVKAADAGPAQAVSEGGSQATDLKTLVATPNVLEVGIASGSHGWLRVRAEFGQAGEVAASVVAASPGAAQGLHKELPAISAYLAGESVGVSSLVVHAAEKGAGPQDAALNNGTGSAAGSQAGPNQRGRDVAPELASPAGSDNDSFGLDAEADFALAGIQASVALNANGSGSWLSVRV